MRQALVRQGMYREQGNSHRDGLTTQPGTWEGFRNPNPILRTRNVTGLQKRDRTSVEQGVYSEF